MKKKILFLSVKSSPKEGKFQYEEGIGPHKLSTLAKKLGYETLIIHDHQFQSDPQRIMDRIEQESRGYETYLGISFLSNGRNLLKELIAQGAARQPVLIGGAGATISPADILSLFLQSSSPVALVQGDAEPVFESLLSISPNEWKNVPGIWSYSGLEISRGKPFVLQDMNQSPFADLSSSSQRKAVETEMNDSSVPLEKRLENAKSLLISQLESRRGCYYRCGYCNVSCLEDELAKVRTSSPERLVREMEHMFHNYGITFFSLTDNIAFDKAEWWREFIGLMKDSEITPYVQFGGYSSPVFINRKEWLDNLIPELYGVGLRGIILGIQAGSERILSDIIHRNPKDPQNALEVTKRVVPLGINLKADFILGHPTETIEELELTEKWAQAIYQAGGEVFIRELQVVPNSAYELALALGAYHLPERTEQFQEKIQGIMQLKAVDDNYRRRAFQGKRVPNKYLIDRSNGIVYPSTHFDLSSLRDNKKLLEASKMPEHIKDRYRKMFDLAIEMKQTKDKYDF